MNDWIKIEDELPHVLQIVYVVCVAENSQRRYNYETMAVYIPYMTVKADDFMIEEYSYESDYNEEEDEFYTREGFYEWQSVADIHWMITDKVTHWRPRIKLPKLNEVKNENN
ncbi:MAG: DUF551 domain-containing protein [Ekhidna sp.]|nr:DUF551 domain-containing protein [Ekhidna sp.]